MYNQHFKSNAAPFGHPVYSQGQAGMGLAGPTPPPFPGGSPMTPFGAVMNPPAGPSGPAGTTTPGMLPIEQSFIENILRLNLGKVATLYMTYENNSQWNAKIFKGRLEAAGRDHIIISDPQTGMRILLLMVNLDYITFDEELQYAYPYGAAAITGR
ncbi:spore coat protein GerQ [Paenibacillus puerhi]|uniref:spore coat protein GerQ n=1 Tax=Paenibacillus puerhi TaxID=2692622 RepID=UPI001357AF92|nr:spore coat protein GerQ [Paenibacillus puerhi]